ncbi:SDR family oxidoreductase [Aureimonas sp. Leaf324]|uniref:SDR family oxidoreductase n=1 Tax=Aureimonas sp. Leaf324 TaxID=1736336 RepID=UPI0006F84FDC|nr:SDR family oxidoreductase [Aureimonas sp. Leaf324]KQQ80729.1 NAD(P)-dependent oxidoreductase [Aureimonas sp. Leaf324]
MVTRPEAGDPKRYFVFGCGYSAGAFLRTRVPEEIVGATTRSAGKAAQLRALGWPPFLFDGGAPGAGIAEALARTTHLVVSIAPGEDGDPVLRRHGEDLRRHAPSLRWIGYLSTVGVYGDHGGAWVDEATPPAPTSKRSRERLEAERAWAALADDLDRPLAILRLSGIYGPGRSPFEKLRAGTARRLVKPGQVFNRIHVDDIAGALAHLASACTSGIFNVTDDEPAPPQDVVAHAADIGGYACPPEIDFATADLTPMARSFYGENKRVANMALKRAGYALRFPTFREGLADCLKRQNAHPPHGISK